MIFILSWTRKTYKLLSGKVSPAGIAFGVGFGLTLGFVPLLSGLGLFLIVCLLAISIPLPPVLFALAIGKILKAIGLTRLFIPVGSALLEAKPLMGFWTWFLNLPLIALLDLDRIAVTGGAVMGIVLGAALFWPIRQLVIGYRKHLNDRVSKNKFFKWLTNNWIIKILRFVFIGPSRGRS
jgi:uncharacterized protein (TIGR03546 family)